MVRIHTHVWGQLEYIEEGRILLLTQNQEHVVEAGSAVWLAGGHPHGWHALSPVRAISFKFEWDSSPAPAVAMRSLQSDAWLQTLPRRAMEAWQGVETARRESANCLLEGLLWALHAEEKGRGDSDTAGGLEREWTLLQEELNRASGPLLALPEMARRTHLSPAHFRRLFKARYGATPGRYQMERRMKRAKGLLQYTRLPIAQVAQRSGFSDVSAFSKAFMRQYGERPSRLRG